MPIPKIDPRRDTIVYMAMFKGKLWRDLNMLITVKVIC